MPPSSICDSAESQIIQTDVSIFVIGYTYMSVEFDDEAILKRDLKRCACP